MPVLRVPERGTYLTMSTGSYTYRRRPSTSQKAHCASRTSARASSAAAAAPRRSILPQSLRRCKATSRQRLARQPPRERCARERATHRRSLRRRHGKPSLLEIVKQRKTVIVELDPPRDLDIEKFMQGSQGLKDAHVDAITMADNSLARDAHEQSGPRSPRAGKLEARVR